MREKIFRWMLRNHPEGQMLTTMQIIVRAILFPIQWAAQSSSAYDPMLDIWTIHGKKYTGEALYALANAEGVVFKVSQGNGCTVLERMDESNNSKSKDQMFLVTAKTMTTEQRERLARQWRTHCESVGMHGCVLDAGMSVEVDRNYGPKLDALIEEQRKTNQLLMQLVESEKC